MTKKITTLKKALKDAYNLKTYQTIQGLIRTLEEKLTEVNEVYNLPE